MCELREVVVTMVCAAGPSELQRCTKRARSTTIISVLWVSSIWRLANESAMLEGAFTAIVIRFFFFSSRRRHTRSLCDWSSDVCSSDLFLPGESDPISFSANDAYAASSVIPFNACSRVSFWSGYHPADPWGDVPSTDSRVIDRKSVV